MRRYSSILSAGVAVILAAGILPSFTALSQRLTQSLPGLAPYLGPINVLKAGAPLLPLFLWINRRSLGRPTLRFVGFFLGLGSLCTLIAAIPCGLPKDLIREWAAMALGMVAATSLTLLPRHHASKVLLAWAALIYGTAFLDFIYSPAIDWLLARYFDPETRLYDRSSTGHWLLSGIFSNQSIAKLLAWTPWLLLAHFAQEPDHKRRDRWILSIGILAMVSTGTILATSQRGPFVGALLGWVAFTIHQATRTGNRRAAWIGATAIAGSLIITLAVVPKSLLVARAKATFGVIEGEDKFTATANYHVSFRRQMLRLSLYEIARNPFGNACIEPIRYTQFSIFPAHAHHMFLQQFRARGWAWGAFHLFCWIFAFVIAWRTRDWAGSALLGGITTIIALGQVDHPWFVLNHAMMLSTYLLMALQMVRKPANAPFKP